MDESIGQLEADGVGAVVAHHGAAESTVVLTPGKMVKQRLPRHLKTQYIVAEIQVVTNISCLQEV